MEPPISMVIAEAVLEELERKAMVDYRSKFWIRFVNDTFAIIKHHDSTKFMEKLIYPDIEFTVEEEINGTLVFLDVLVSRQINGTLSTAVHRKTTHRSDFTS